MHLSSLQTLTETLILCQMLGRRWGSCLHRDRIAQLLTMVPVYSSSLASEMAFLWWRKRSLRKFCEIKRGAAFYLVTNKPKNLKRLFFKNCHLLVLERKCNAFYQAHNTEGNDTPVALSRKRCRFQIKLDKWPVTQGRTPEASGVPFLNTIRGLTLMFQSAETLGSKS